MSTILVLTLVLFIAMVVAGGMKGFQGFIGLLINFGLVFMSVVLISFGIPYLWVTIANSVIILVITIYFGNEQGRNADIAFITSLIVVFLVILLIIPVEHWAQVQGFGVENTEDLEGLSLYVGVKFLDVTCAMTILSCLGAVSEAAIALSTGLVEIEDHNPAITPKQIKRSGIAIGKEIIGTAFNTLFFGFYGELIGLFIWFARLHYSFGMVINDKIFVSELIIILVSAIGVVLTIPVTILVMIWQKKRALGKN